MILFLVLLLLMAVLGGAFYAYYVAFYSPKSKRNLPPRFDRKSYAPYRGELESGYQQLRQREWESVTISSREGRAAPLRFSRGKRMFCSTVRWG